MTSTNFSGKKYLVTGAGRGLGRAIAKALVNHGGKVYALNRSQEPLDVLVSEHPGSMIPIKADIENWDEIREKIKDIDVLDGLINNAIAFPSQRSSGLQWDRDFLQKSVNVNVLGPINMIQVVAQKMIKSGRPGSIVNISSIASLQAIPGTLPYCVTKAALDMVTKQFALELAENNIRVNSVNPTLILTETVRDKIREGVPLDEMFIQRTPMKRVAQMEEIVSPVLYLLSDQSSMVTGTLQVIDGGLMASF